MSDELHPYRYVTQMKMALDRIERIHADAATTEGERHAELGMPEDLRSFCSKATSHLEKLIANWNQNGRVSYEVENMVLAAQGEVYGLSQPTSLPTETVFLKFVECDPRLELEERGVFIEGCYLQELLDSAEIELTFVCAEPLWAETNDLRYTEALVVASRIAIGRVTRENSTEARRSAFAYAGQDSILSDPALGKAMSLAVSALQAISPASSVHPSIRH